MQYQKNLKSSMTRGFRVLAAAFPLNRYLVCCTAALAQFQPKERDKLPSFTKGSFRVKNRSAYPYPSSGLIRRIRVSDRLLSKVTPQKPTTISTATEKHLSNNIVCFLHVPWINILSAA